MPTKATRLSRNKRHKTGHPGQLKKMRSSARMTHQDKALDRQELRARHKFPKPDRLPESVLKDTFTSTGYRVGWSPSRVSRAINELFDEAFRSRLRKKDEGE